MANDFTTIYLFLGLFCIYLFFPSEDCSYFLFAHIIYASDWVRINLHRLKVKIVYAKQNKFEHCERWVSVWVFVPVFYSFIVMSDGKNHQFEFRTVFVCGVLLLINTFVCQLCAFCNKSLWTRISTSEKNDGQSIWTDARSATWISMCFEWSLKFDMLQCARINDSD